MSLLKKSKQDTKQKAKKRKKEQSKPKQTKNKVSHISNAIPVHFDNEHQCFIDDDGCYIGMLKTAGTNLFGFKQSDQQAYCVAFSNMFSASVGAGQIYSYEVPADVDGYVKDYDVLKRNLNVLENEQDRIKYDILSKESNRLIRTSLSRHLVDRGFLIILKDKDYQKLQRRLKEVINCLSMYQKTYILDGLEMIEVIYNYYNPTDSQFQETTYKDNPDVMDIIYPDYIGKYNAGWHQCIALNGLYTKSKYVALYQSEPVFAMLSYLATLRNVEFSLHFEPAPSDSITKELDSSIKNINKNLDKSKDASTQTQLVKERAQNQEMIDMVIAEGSLPLFFSVSIRIKGDTPQLVDEISHEIDNETKKLGLKLREGIFQPLELFNLTAPICKNQVPQYMSKTTADTMGDMYPFVFESLYDSTYEFDVKTKEKLFNYPPVYIGNTIDTNGVVFYDNFMKKDDRSNYNEFIVGNSGMGKTFFIMSLIHKRFSIGYKQYIIDVEGKELNKLTHYLGGANINCSNGDLGRINPLHIRFNIPDEDDASEDKTSLDKIFPLSEHIRFLRAFLGSYKGEHTNEVGLLVDNAIEKAIITVYEDYGITFKTSAQEILDHFKNEDYPIMMDVYNKLVKQLELIKLDKQPDKEEITRIKTAMAFLDPMCLGADANLFNGCTNVDLDNSLICFNVSALQDNTENKVLKAQYFNILSFIWTNIISNPNHIRQTIYADEFSVIMDPRYQEIMMYFQTIAKRIRKRYGSLCTATQQISDVLKESVKEQGEAIIEQSVYQFYFGLGVQGIEYFNKTNLIPQSEREFVQFAGLGDCYAKIGSQTAMRVHISLDDETLRVFESLKG